MTTYIIRRLFQLIPVLFGVTLLVFLLMHLTPGIQLSLLRVKQHLKVQLNGSKSAWD